MPPSCAIRFRNEDERAQVYKHYHGYPQSVIPSLYHLGEVLEVTNAYRTPGYCAAQFVFLDKLWDFIRPFRTGKGMTAEVASLREVVNPERWENRPAPRYLLGHSIEDPSRGIRGDEEYLYVVELPDDIEGQWNIKVSYSGQFPREGDKGTDRAFELVTWRYQRTLDDLLSIVRKGRG